MIDAQGSCVQRRAPHRYRRLTVPPIAILGLMTETINKNRTWSEEMDALQEKYSKRSDACAAVRSELAGIDQWRVRDPGDVLYQIRAHVDLTENLLVACQERDTALRAVDATARANDGKGSPELMAMVIDLDRRAAGLQLRCDIAAETLRCSIERWPITRQRSWWRQDLQAVKTVLDLVPQLLRIAAELPQFAPDWSLPQP